MGIRGLETFVDKTPGADGRVFVHVSNLSKWLNGRLLLVDYAGMYING